MIAIIHINDLNGAPYYKKYVQVLKENGIEYEIIGWDRTGKIKNDNEIEHRILFHYKSDENKGITKKLPDFIKYAGFLNKILKEKRYEKIIILNTLTAFLLIKHIRKYKNKFILDIRDLSYEYIPFFKKVLGKIIDRAYFTCISSPGFKKELPEGKEYIIAHNFQYKAIENELAKSFKKRENSVINLLHVGIGRGDDYNKLLADIFGNDKRFSLVFAGIFNDTPFFTEYVKKYSNIKVFGTYVDDEKKRFIENSDMLFYNYMSSYNCNCALANKYYDGLIFKKPLLGNIATYSGKLIEEKGVGISVDFDDPDYADKVYKYYMSLNEEEYINNVKKELDRVLLEDKIYLDKIKEFFNK